MSSSLRIGALTSFFLAALVGQAHAVSSLGVIWDATNTPTITVSSTTNTVLRAGIRAVGDTAGIGGIFISFNFDVDGLDELNIAQNVPKAGKNGGTEQTTNLPGGGNSFGPGLPGYNRNQIESTPGNAGLLGSYDVTSGGTGLVSATRTLGSIFFTTNAANVVDDSVENGPDVALRVLSDGFDAVLDGAGNDISQTVALSGAHVNSGRDLAPSVPEATTSMMLLAGLSGLLWAGRRQH